MMAENFASATRLRLLSELAVWRYGWCLPLAAGSIVAALLVCLVWLPLQYTRLKSAQTEWARVGEFASGVSEVPGLPPLQQFREALAMQDATPAQLRLIHQKAQEAGLNVAQLDMRRQSDPGGGFSQLQISMPLKGNYLAFKRFCAEILARMPSVSIDQVIIKREQTNTNIVEIQLSLSIWQQLASAGPAVVRGAR